MLKTGIKAPDFELYAAPDKKVSLNLLKGKKVILVFYPADWSPVCSDELNVLNQALPLFEKENAVVLGLSVDGRWCHLAFAENRKIQFPLLADFEPKGAVSKLYDVYDDAKGVSERALFLIDEEGIIRWSYLSPLAVNPGVDGVLDALDKLSKR